MNFFRPRRVLLFLASSLLLLGGLCGPTWYSWHHRLRAMNTVANLRALWVVCESSQAKSAADVYAECERLGATCAKRDGWGRPYLIEINPETDATPRCQIRSLGRDGQRSSCCQVDAGWCWDLDAVFDGELRQVWNTLGGGSGVPCPSLGQRSK